MSNNFETIFHDFEFASILFFCFKILNNVEPEIFIYCLKRPFGLEKLRFLLTFFQSSFRKDIFKFSGIFFKVITFGIISEAIKNNTKQGYLT